MVAHPIISKLLCGATIVDIEPLIICPLVVVDKVVTDVPVEYRSIASVPCGTATILNALNGLIIVFPF